MNRSTDQERIRLAEEKRARKNKPPQEAVIKKKHEISDDIPSTSATPTPPLDSGLSLQSAMIIKNRGKRSNGKRPKLGKLGK